MVLVKVGRPGEEGGEMRAVMDALCPAPLGPLLLLMVLARALLRRPRLAVGDIGLIRGGDFEREESTAFTNAVRLEILAGATRGEKISTVFGSEDVEGRVR